MEWWARWTNSYIYLKKHMENTNIEKEFVCWLNLRFQKHRHLINDSFYHDIYYAVGPSLTSYNHMTARSEGRVFPDNSVTLAWRMRTVFGNAASRKRRVLSQEFSRCYYTMLYHHHPAFLILGKPETKMVNKPRDPNMASRAELSYSDFLF